MIFRSLFIFLACSVIFFSCEKIQSYPPEPNLSYNSHKVEYGDGLGNKVVRIEVKIDFVDGDGDMIVEKDPRILDDTTSYSILYALCYPKKNGTYQQIPDSTNKYRLDFKEFMRRDGQNKTLKGTITRFIIPSYFRVYDTLKIGFYVIDRAYHKSNIVEITDIPLIKK